MIEVECPSRDPKYLYWLEKNMPLIQLKIEEGNVKMNTELSVAEAESLADELMELVNHIKGES